MFRKVLFFVFCATVALSVAACGGTAKKEDLSLNEDEKETLELVDEDIHVITDDDYAQTVGELAYHGNEYSGQLYQLEGLYQLEDGAPNVSRTLVDGENKTACGLPLKYVQKDIADGSWIRVTGVVSTDEVNEEDRTVLEVVAIETLPKSGKAELPWEGGSEHQH